MKTLLYKMIIIPVVMLVFHAPANSQNKFEISGGIGFPETIAIKIKYGNNLQIGVSQGFWLFSILNSPPEIINGPTIGEIYYHFSGHSQYEAPPPWYLYGGLAFRFGESYLLFCPRAGRTFYISDRSGVNIDLGALIPLTKDFLDNINSPLLPSGSIGLFYRF